MAAGCFLHAVRTKLSGVLESVCLGHAFAFGGPLPRARALQGGGGKVWFIGLMEEICHWSKEV